jgi:ectoine hydroxylase-related dioxygenase (phytanoyl-CoA dioxygenase family)
VHYHHAYSQAALDITSAPAILHMCQLILEDQPVLISSIGFRSGSEVGLHQDICALHIHPTFRLVGVWVACEDVGDEAGPLTVYPGTHRAPVWSGWNNYPQTNLRTCHLDTRDEYGRYLTEMSKGIEPRGLVVRKGDVIFQHSQQIHYGAKIEDPVITRKSMVLHYSVPGGNRGAEIVGPFNW